MSDYPITDLDAANYAVDYFSWWMFHEEKRADEAEAKVARLTERCDAYKEALTDVIATYDFTYLDRKAVASARDKIFLKARAALAQDKTT